ncbi:hypothetical protein ACIRO3_35280 [Streptomyces sp. NPDC102278]|uniref:hypothetical protein n=1 Tax=Streptomyces sp. NPDC102278 TaxID=3366152 RepID=UPI003800D170
MSRNKKTGGRAARTTAVVASLACAGSLMAVVYTSNAQATPADGTSAGANRPSPEALLREEISKAANALYDTAHRDPRTGYAGIVVAAQDGGYTLNWKGVVPQSVTRLIEAQRASGLTVSVKASRYTSRELNDRARAIAASKATIGGAAITSVGPNGDGNSLNITVAPRTAPGAAASLTAESLRSVSAHLPESLTGGIPVHLTERAAAVSIASPPGRGNSALQRNADAPPWIGGSVIRIGNGTCTSGFNVYDPNTQKNYMLTAAHCGKVKDIVRNGESSATLGTLVDEEEWLDSALVEYGAGGITHAALGRIYSGYGVARAGFEWRGVAAARRSFIGEENICTSGALMGEVCGGRIVNKDVLITPGGAPTASVDEVWQIAKVAMAGSGDSGGPAYVRTLSGDVSPRGVLSATAPDGGRHSCHNPLNFGTRPSCNSTVYITKILDSMDEHVRNLNSVNALQIKTH